MVRIQLGNIGTALRLLVQDEDGIVDISAATQLQIVLEKPDETSATKTAALSNDGTDGLMQYVTVSGDLDQVGVWQIQGIVQFGGGQVFYTEVELFRVYDNL